MRFASIIAVHGLDSSVESTWVHKESKTLWLRDFLCLEGHMPTARVMVFRYDSKWKSNALFGGLQESGTQLKDVFLDLRRNLVSLVSLYIR